MPIGNVSKTLLQASHIAKIFLSFL